MKKFLISVPALLAATILGAQTIKLTPGNIDSVISQMTTEEKVNLIVGCGAGWGNPDAKFPGTAGWTRAIPRLGIPSIYFADGPQGVNMEKTREYDTFDYSCTFFLSGSSLASSWDTGAAAEIGQAIGYELKERGLDVILGPGMNLHRNILCGRNQEYFSEDPVLSGKIAASWIKGAQSNGIATSLKHFAVNNQETNRKENDSRVDPRTLRELYLKGFEIAVKEGKPLTVMSSYNYINGVHAAESADLLDGILRKEWGWDGVVMSDWDAVVVQSEAVKATCDLIEPGTDADREALLKAIADGSLPISDVDRNVRHILSLVVKSPSFLGYEPSNDVKKEEHRALLRRVAAESMVLLKNEGGVLPLKKGNVALYGCSSYDLVPANMGVGGSNMGVYHVSLVQGMREAGFNVDRDILREYTDYIPSAKEKIESAFPPIYKQFYRFDRPEEIIPGNDNSSVLSPEQAAMTADLGIQVANSHRRWTVNEQAKENDAAIITLARTTGEAFDRLPEEFRLTESELNLIREISKGYHAEGKPVIVLLNIPAAIETASWREMIDAILVVGQPGERAGESIADALTVKTAPSGRLVESWPVNYGDAPADRNFPNEGAAFDVRSLMGRGRKNDPPVSGIDYTDYEEGIYVGYRYFTSFGKEMAYPFGYGQTYTTFSYENPEVSLTADGIVAKVTVRNTGSRPGKEVVQLYVSAPSGGLEKPSRELKGFVKTGYLRPGETEAVEIPLTLYDLASYNPKKVAWQTAKGTYVFRFCTSSADSGKEVPLKISKASEWKTGALLLPED
ncbi:MAG: glycoside hydrolase family 3 C-terminal domain-containing protein [Bacteroidales bacterium]|nr:glycoside hydrolase family 3 C-terminal domain-containing protein [Bacteroidales bacterium]